MFLQDHCATYNWFNRVASSQDLNYKNMGQFKSGGVGRQGLYTLSDPSFLKKFPC